MKQAIIITIFILLMSSLVAAAPLSVIKSDYIEFDNDLLTSAWQLILRGNNDAEHILFMPASSMKAEVDGEDVEAKEDMKLETEIISETCSYPLIRTNQRTDIYTYREEVKPNLNVWNYKDHIEGCRENGAIFVWVTGIRVLFDFDVHCLYEDLEAIAGDVKEARVNFNAKFTLTKEDGETSIETLSNLGAADGTLPTITFKDEEENNIAIIRWIGGVTFGEQCPGQDNVISLEKGNNWYLGNKARHQEYSDKQAELYELSFSIGEQLSSEELAELNRVIEAVNIRAQNAMDADYIRLGSTTSSISDSNAIITLPRDHLIYAPDFQMFISTEWLRIKFLTSKPKITDAFFTTCVEGSEDNEIKVTIQNIGEATGKFTSGISCDRGITLSTTERSITLDPEESGTLTYPFSISLTEDDNKRCKITVIDAFNPDSKDEKTINTECSATRFCSPDGIVKCVGEVQFLCSKGQWISTDSTACQRAICNQDGKCEPERGESFEACGGKGNPNNECATCNFDDTCDSTETSTSCPADCELAPPTDLTWLYVVVAVIVAVGIYFGVQEMKKKKGKFKIRPRRRSRSKIIRGRR